MLVHRGRGCGRRKRLWPRSRPRRTRSWATARPLQTRLRKAFQKALSPSVLRRSRGISAGAPFRDESLAGAVRPDASESRRGGGVATETSSAALRTRQGGRTTAAVPGVPRRLRSGPWGAVTHEPSGRQRIRRRGESSM